MHFNNKIHCLIIDDEPPAREILRQHIAGVEALELTGTCSNAVEAVSFLKEHPVDLLLLDIQMPQILGTQFIRTLKNPPKVIFTTAYRKFAVEGFELDAVDYLLKPITFERFLKAVNKVIGQPAQEAPPAPVKHEMVTERFIHLRADRKVQKVALGDIIYIESLKDYCKIITTSRQIITRQAISSIETSLPADGFIRIHRSYIVSV